MAIFRGSDWNKELDLRYCKLSTEGKNVEKKKKTVKRKTNHGIVSFNFIEIRKRRKEPLNASRQPCDR